MITTPPPDTRIINEPNITIVEVKATAGTPGATTFITLSDTPSTYAGQAGLFTRVNVAEDGIEFFSIPSAPVDSVFGRVGAVVAVSGDYAASFITNDSGVTGATVDLALDNLIKLTEKGTANGVATLDGSGRMPSSQLPTSATEYKGSWDASTNTPALASGVGTNGDLYIVSVAGSTNLDGITDWEIGDNLIFNGSLVIWQKIDNSDIVSSVFGRIGTVTAQLNDYTASLVDNDSSVVGATVKDALETLSAASGTPGGADTQIQFNDSGAFGGDADFIWNKTTNLLTVNGRINVNTTTDNTFITGGVDAAGGSGNTGMGALCLDSLQAGSSNTGYGIAALSAVNSGDSNVGVGGSALAAVNSGDRNTAVGTTCLWLNTGSNNTAIGYDAGAISTGNDSVYIGYQAGRNASGSGLLYISNSSTSTPLIYGEFSNDLLRINDILDVTAKIQIGTFNALRTSDGDITGSQSLFVGNTGNITSTGLGCIAIGHNAMTSNTSGTNNISIGPFSMFINQTGTSNSAFGRSALEQNVAGSSNSAFGHESLKAISASSFNTAFGARAMRLKTSGLFNTAVGANSFENNLSGSSNVGLGYQAGRDELGSNKLYIANTSTSTPLIYGEFDNAVVTINGDLSFTGILNMPVLSSNPTTVNGDVWLVETGGQTFLRAQTSGGVKGVQLT